MNATNERLLKLGLRVPDLLLPAPDVNLEKWAVIACDQYTSRREYWESVREIVGRDPSTLNMILPEVYLNDPDTDTRITAIASTMRRYLEHGVLVESPSCCILVERKTPHAPVRTGLVIAVDLEKYDYMPGSKSLIRATERTILERIPPRERIRSACQAEFPHAMVLLDDPSRSVIEPIAAECRSRTPSYDFELMAGGGHIRGYRIDSSEQVGRIAAALEALDSKRGTGTDKAGFLFAVGDGNHSLAAAKSVWEKVKRSSGDWLHPSRFALVELLNVYDEGLVFHPIHRVLFGIDPEAVLSWLERQPGVSVLRGVPREAVVSSVISGKEAAGRDYHETGFVSAGGSGLLRISSDRHTATGALQDLLDAFLQGRNASIDYIHGEDEVFALSRDETSMGFLLPVMRKEALFPTVDAEGILPRKAFSIGESVEKRYYMEGRRIMD